MSRDENRGGGVVWTTTSVLPADDAYVLSKNILVVMYEKGLHSPGTASCSSTSFSFSMSARKSL